jgi:hypothetical protein
MNRTELSNLFIFSVTSFAHEIATMADLAMFEIEQGIAKVYLIGKQPYVPSKFGALT